MDWSARHDGSGAGLIHASIVKGLLPTGKSAAMPSLWSRQLLPLRSISSIAEKRSASSFGNGGRGGGDGGGGDGGGDGGGGDGGGGEGDGGGGEGGEHTSATCHVFGFSVAPTLAPALWSV